MTIEHEIEFWNEVYRAACDLYQWAAEMNDDKSATEFQVDAVMALRNCYEANQERLLEFFESVCGVYCKITGRTAQGHFIFRLNPETTKNMDDKQKVTVLVRAVQALNAAGYKAELDFNNNRSK